MRLKTMVRAVLLVLTMLLAWHGYRRFTAVARPVSHACGVQR